MQRLCSYYYDHENDGIHSSRWYRSAKGIRFMKTFQEMWRIGIFDGIDRFFVAYAALSNLQSELISAVWVSVSSGFFSVGSSC